MGAVIGSMHAVIQFPNISPNLFAIDIGGFEIALRWYALAYIAGILLARWIVLRALRRSDLWPNDTAPMSDTQLENLITWIIVGIIAGGRLGYVFFYADWAWWADPVRILAVWEGGMSFHGGFLGVAIAGLIFCWRQKIPLGPMGDAFALGTPFGLMLGRLANFINAELWGRETTVPWGIVFPGADAQTCVNAAVGFCARHPSQLYEALGEGLILGIVLTYLAFRKSGLKRTGLLLGLFLAGYGIVRFLVELVRQPDAQFQGPNNPIGYALHLGDWGLTMGQLLSIPMILAGLYFCVRANVKS